jgi:hypothetical protein
MKYISVKLVAALAVLDLLAGYPEPAMRAGAAEPLKQDLVRAVVRLPSHGASATVIETREGRTLLLSCGHAFMGEDRYKPIVVDAPARRAGTPRHVGIRLVAVDYDSDLSLIVLNGGPVDFTVAVAPEGFRPGRGLLSVGFDEMRMPATARPATLAGQDGAVTYTRERPWHGRSGGALLDVDSGQLIGVVSGYEVNGLERGMYASHAAIVRFLARGKPRSVPGPLAPTQPTPGEPHAPLPWRIQAQPFCPT